jgi:hypothetical protein
MSFHDVPVNILRQFIFLCFGEKIRSFGCGVAELGSERHNFPCCSRIKMDNFYSYFALYSISHGKGFAAGAGRRVMRGSVTLIFDIFVLYTWECMSRHASRVCRARQETWPGGPSSAMTPQHFLIRTSQFYQMNN